MDISAILKKELSVGPFYISLSELGITEDLQNKLGALPNLFEALALMYILGVVFSGLAILGSAAGLFAIPPGGRKVPLANSFVAALAMQFLLVGSLLMTVGARKANDEIQKMGGDDIGLVVDLGKKFEALSWASFALMTFTTFYWVYETLSAHHFCRRGVIGHGRRQRQDQKYSIDSCHSGGRHSQE